MNISSSQPQSDTISFSHISGLKNLSYEQLKGIKEGKTSTVSINNKQFTVSWSEREQNFEVNRVGNNRFNIFSISSSNSKAGRLCSGIADVTRIKQAMLQCQASYAKSRSAAYSSPRDRVESTIDNIFTGGSVPITIQRVAENREEEWKPSLATSTVSSTNNSSSGVTVEPPHVLVYGYAATRAILMSALEKKGINSRATVLTIDAYNKCLGLEGSLSIQKYCDIGRNLQAIKEAKDQQQDTDPLITGMIDTNKLADVSSDYPSGIGTADQKKAWLTARVERWVEFLADHRENFNFARKLENPGTTTASVRGAENKNIHFFIKNIQNNILDACHRDAKGHFNAGEWDQFLEKLDPIFALIRQMDGNNFDSLETVYNSLTSDNQAIFSSVMEIYFFRQTSKLGLSFAAANNINILFSWQDPTGKLELDALHEALQTKIYKDNDSPDFRSGEYHEGITYSEMRELGRLSEEDTIARAQDPNAPKIVPNYLLIRKLA